MCTICQALQPENPRYSFHDFGDGLPSRVPSVADSRATVETTTMDPTDVWPEWTREGDGTETGPRPIEIPAGLVDKVVSEPTGGDAADEAIRTLEVRTGGNAVPSGAVLSTEVANSFPGSKSIGVSDGGSTGGKPIYTLDQIADYLTHGFWNETGSSARHFNVQSGGTITYNLDGLTAGGAETARKALDAWTAVSGLQFKAASASSAQMVFDDNSSGAYAWSSFYGGQIFKSTINIHSSWSNYGGYYLQTYIHEIGHALGLGHAGNYNGSASYSSDAHYANESWQTSIMSYFDETENTFVNAKFGYVLTPQMADILAIQNLYGANPTARAGNTVYGVGATQDAKVNILGNSAATLYDSGGIDTIDLSSSAASQRLDLNAETFSDTNGMIGNLGIARGTVIENATTGAGNDTVIGNGAGNLIRTGNGNDTVFGKGGDDKVHAGSGSNNIDGGTGKDTVFLEGAVSGYSVIYDYKTYTGEILKLLDGAGGINTLLDVEWLSLEGTNYSVSSLFTSLSGALGSLFSGTVALGTYLFGTPSDPEPEPEPLPEPEPAPVPDPEPVSPSNPDAPIALAATLSIEIVESGRKRIDLLEQFKDPNGDRLTLQLKDAPDFAYINHAGKLIIDPEGTSDNGIYTLSVSAFDGTYTSSPMTVEVAVGKSYWGADDGATDPETGNSAPELLKSPDPVTLGEGDSTRLTLSDYVRDADNDPLTWTLQGAPAFATITSGELVLTPRDGNDGTYSFTVVASDGSLQSDPMVIDLSVTDTGTGVSPTNPDAPVALATTYSIDIHESGRKRIDLLEQFDDPNGDTLTLQLQDAPDFAYINHAGKLILDPEGAGDNGTYIFSVAAFDGTYTSSPMTVALAVGESYWNDGPGSDPTDGGTQFNDTFDLMAFAMDEAALGAGSYADIHLL